MILYRFEVYSNEHVYSQETEYKNIKVTIKYNNKIIIVTTDNTTHVKIKP